MKKLCPFDPICALLCHCVPVFWRYCVFRVLENEHAVVTHPLVNGVLRVATVCLGSGILFA